MGKVLSIVNKQINRFNVENRAHRVLSRDKPTPAPWHPTTRKHLDQAESTIKDELMSKHESLNENLRRVYVVSEGPAPHRRLKPSERARLPSNRGQMEENEFGYVEPATVPAGFVTLKQALKIIATHAEDSAKHDVNYIAKEYKLQTQDSFNLLKYYASFQMLMPDKKKISDTRKLSSIWLPAAGQTKLKDKEVDLKQMK